MKSTNEHEWGWAGGEVAGLGKAVAVVAGAEAFPVAVIAVTAVTSDGAFLVAVIAVTAATSDEAVRVAVIAVTAVTGDGCFLVAVIAVITVIAVTVGADGGRAGSRRVADRSMSMVSV